MFFGAYLLSFLFFQLCVGDVELSCSVKSPKQTFYLPNCQTSPDINLDERYRSTVADREFDKIIRPFSVDGTIVVTSASYAHLSMTLNWVKQLRKQEVKNFFVFCLDPLICQKLRRRNIPSSEIPNDWLPSPFKLEETQNEFSWGNRNYNILTQTRSFVILQLLSLGYKVIFSDVDVGFPNPGFYSHTQYRFDNNPNVAFFASQDLDDSSRYLLPNICGGYFAVRPDPISFQIFETLAGVSLRRIAEVDQFILNEIFDLMGLKFNGIHSSKVHYLDPNLFVSGGHLGSGEGRDYYLRKALFVHANYLIGKESKIGRLKELGVWHMSE